MITMKEDIRKQWVEALRSGRFEQGKEQLKTRDGKFCCLGVLCELAIDQGVIPAPQLDGEFRVWTYNGQDIELPETVKNWAGLGDNSGRIDGFNTVTRENSAVIGGIETGWLSDANDKGATFEEIAAYIEGGKA